MLFTEWIYAQKDEQPDNLFFKDVCSDEEWPSGGSVLNTFYTYLVNSQSHDSCLRQCLDSWLAFSGEKWPMPMDYETEPALTSDDEEMEDDSEEEQDEVECKEKQEQREARTKERQAKWNEWREPSWLRLPETNIRFENLECQMRRDYDESELSAWFVQPRDNKWTLSHMAEIIEEWRKSFPRIPIWILDRCEGGLAFDLSGRLWDGEEDTPSVRFDANRIKFPFIMSRQELRDLSLLRSRMDYHHNMLRPRSAYRPHTGITMCARNLPSDLTLQFMRICAELNHHVYSVALHKKFVDVTTKGKRSADNMGIRHVRRELTPLLQSLLSVGGLQEMVIQYFIGHEFEVFEWK